MSTDQEALRALLAGAADHVLLRLRPDRAEPAPRQPRAAARSCAACSSPATSRSGLVGGSTGLIGDPRPSAERTLNTKETVAEWVGYLRSQVERFLSFEGENAARIVNNLDWTAPLSAIDFLRDIGKHYRVGTMLKKDAVSARLNSDAGISYTEFSYQILQGLDYLELFRQYGCVLQTGGSDQWGNLTSGVDLIHRVEGRVGARDRHAADHEQRRHASSARARATRSGSTPRCAARTRMYQFWLNTDDADVIDAPQGLHVPHARRDRGVRAARRRPSRSAASAQKRLALEVTTLRARTGCRGRRDRGIRGALRSGRSDGARCRRRSRSALEELPNAELAGRHAASCRRSSTPDWSRASSEARRAIAQGGVSLDGVKVEDDAARRARARCPGGVSVLRRGKKTLAGVFVA